MFGSVFQSAAPGLSTVSTPAAPVVTPPSSTSDSKASGANFTAKTFGAFTDSSSVIASYQAATVNASGSASWSGSGLGPYTASSTAGDAGSLLLNAKNAAGDVVATATHAYDRAAATAAAWSALLDVDFKALTTSGALSAGSTTLNFSGGSTIDIDLTRFAGATDASVTATGSTGLVCDGGTDTAGGICLSVDVDPKLSSYTRADVMSGVYAFHVVLSSISLPLSGGSNLIVGINHGNNTAHNGGNARMLFIEDDGSSQEDIKVKRLTTASSVLATQAKRTSRVVTIILSGGSVVEVMDTSGTTPPTPSPGGAGAFVVGSDSVALADTTPQYQDQGVRIFMKFSNTTDCVWERLYIERLG